MSGHQTHTIGSTRLAAVQARLDALINWERRDRSAGMRIGIEPMLDLLARLDQPERAMRCVHVGGSKGKGSVAALVAAGLRAAGWRSGCYASPHVELINERVRIDGENVPDELLAIALETVLAAREQALTAGSSSAEATWFDLMTAAALFAFRERAVDWAVLEVGLGGRLDSTNAVDGELVVITNIELEHTSVLGDTRVAIALEKAGILNPAATLVCGLPAGDEAGDVIRAHARALGSPVHEPPDAGPEAGPESWPEALNVRLAREALDALGANGVCTPGGRALDGELLDEPTIAAARLPGRQERCSWKGLPVVLDGAHVARSLTLLLDELLADGSVAPVVVLSLGRDKDARACLKAMAGRVDRVISTSVPSGVHRTADELDAIAREFGMSAQAITEPEAALERACSSAAPTGWVLVTGSLYLVGALRALLVKGAAEA